jgi:crotonobetainyl-CoA:carnitine CoA-transferase CaiB-like acyl-CoA transferase
VSGPLAGLRVVDCSRGTAGPRASGILADYGAEVIWVEPPGGDPWRDALAIEYSVTNRGKRSVVVDLRSPDRAAIDELLASADVFVESWRPGVAVDLGLGFEQLHARFPSLMMCSISGFGVDGPHRGVPGFEALVHAVVGTMGEQVGHREGPIFEGLPFASIGASYLAVIGLLAGLHRRMADGVGRHVETSLLDGALSYLAIFWGESDFDVGARRNVAPGVALPVGGRRLVTGSFLCEDGEYIGVHTGAVGAFSRLMEALGLDDRIKPSRGGHDMGTPLTPDERKTIEAQIHGIFASRPRAWWIDRLLAADVCGIPQLNPCEVFDEPQARFNRMVIEVDDPVLGVVQQVAPAIRFSVTDPVVRAAAPAVGATTLDDLLAEARRLGPSSWVGAGPPDMRPLLADVRILDLGAYFAGPYSSRLLADLGADVIKVESVTGDAYRGAGRQFTTPQAGKRTIAVDLKHPDAASIRAALLQWADVVHHNMRPGAAERIGVGPADAAVVNPDLIYGLASGWGSEGPYRGRQSFEPMMSGYVGVGFEVAGRFNAPLYPAGHADPANGLLGAIAMLMALVHRRRTGQAQNFENPQLNATMAQLAHVVRRPDGTVLNAGRLDTLQYGFGPLERLYRTADGWLCIVAATDAHLAGLSASIEIDLVADERFATPEARRDHGYTLSELLTTTFLQRPTDVWLERLTANGVPAAEPRPYANQAFMNDPENRRTGRVVELPHERWGSVRELARFLRATDAEAAPRRVAPEHGQQTDEILRSVGYGDEQIHRLRSRGVIR